VLATAVGSLNLPAANYCSVALHNPRARSWQVLFIQNSFLSEREALPPWLSVTVGFRLSWHALRPPTLSLCRFAVGSARADNLRRDIVLAWPIFQPQSGVFADAGNDLRGVMGTGRRGDGAVQSWVKPTEAAGAAEEAHRRWPGRRSEQARAKCKSFHIKDLRTDVQGMV